VSSRRRHTRSKRDWSSDVCSSDLMLDQLRKMSFKGNNTTINKGDNIFNNTTINNKGDLVDSKGNVIIKEINKEIDKIIKDNLQRSEERRVGKECIKQLRNKS